MCGIKVVFISWRTSRLESLRYSVNYVMWKTRNYSSNFSFSNSLNSCRDQSDTCRRFCFRFLGCTPLHLMTNMIFESLQSEFLEYYLWLWKYNVTFSDIVDSLLDLHTWWWRWWTRVGGLCQGLAITWWIIIVTRIASDAQNCFLKLEYCCQEDPPPVLHVLCML